MVGGETRILSLFLYLNLRQTPEKSKGTSVYNDKNCGKLVCFENDKNRTAHIRHQCWKTIILCYHRCLINTAIEKMNNI